MIVDLSEEAIVHSDFAVVLLHFAEVSCNYAIVHNINNNVHNFKSHNSNNTFISTRRPSHVSEPERNSQRNQNW